ncbi:MAG: MATE family efflux transporter [Tissierellales bacterium]|nr:MATE family efflux transporter [Tissierellales bacterium]MBN2828501.1 MATE family efflux transporter [Tissierellales bacterium]
MASEKNNLVQGEVKHTIMRMTVPMILGMLSMVVFNLTDTFYIGQLGTDPLAAISFTFPVVLVVNSVALGMGIGASSIVARAAGEKNQDKLIKTATDSIVLSFVFVLFASILGLQTIDETFRMLGADEEMLFFIRQYMSLWYFGMPFVVIPMVGNSIIRALGDTKTPSIVMGISAAMNVLLDPMLIFGLGIFPEMGIKGAALATVISRMLTFFVALYILIFREKIVRFRIRNFQSVFHSWLEILYVGVPSAIVRMITPISTGIITRMIAEYGTEAVAGYGVGTKVEFFTLSFINALSSVLIPFAGQNYGAGQRERIIEGIKFSRKIVFVYGIAIFLLMKLTSGMIASIFNDNPTVQKITVLYLTIVPLGYGFQGMFLNSTAILNAINKPLHAALLSLLQMFAIYVPISWILEKYFGIYGIFSAIIVSYLISGTLATRLTKGIIQKEKTTALQSDKGKI